MDTSMSATELRGTTGDNKTDTEEDTRSVRASSEQYLCQSALRTRQKQERLKASVNGSCEAMQGRMDALLAGHGFVEKPYYYIFLFRHNLF